MSLSNYVMARNRRNGGIRMIGLIEKTDVASITYENASKGYSDITPEQGCYFSKYEFREDQAEYKETVSVVNGAQVVTHELTFMIDKMGNDCSPAITSIADAARNGLIALLLTPNGDTFVVGYSTEFGMERPLHLAAVSGSTGKQLAESSSETITLRSHDVSKAKPFYGDMEGLFSLDE